MATLKVGSKGDEVSKLQQQLKDNGYNVSVDGIYGSETAAAVKAFQSNNGLTADGIYGTQTSSKLNSGTYTPGYASAVTTNNSTTSSSSNKTSSDNSLSQYYKKKMLSYDDEDLPTFSTGDDTNNYKSKLTEYENSEPDAFSSRYDSTINEILNTIKNRGSFDLSTDTNYQQLYNNYQESYKNQAQKAMRDTMANAQLATGGYGSTYSQIAGQQAYDNTMQGMNDQNINLMNLAYSMYSDDRANDYNMLNAYQNQDNTDYSRYRDTYNDWYNNRNYYANQYDNSYNRDYTDYRNDVSDYYTNRDYYTDQYNSAYDNEYQAERDAISDTENTYATALSYASSGYDIPSYLKSQLSTEDQAYFDNIKQTAIANASKSSGGGQQAEETVDESQYEKMYNMKQNMLQGIEYLKGKQNGKISNSQKYQYYKTLKAAGFDDEDAEDVYDELGIDAYLLKEFKNKNVPSDNKF